MGVVETGLAILLLAIIATVLIALPVHLAAGAMHARRTGFLWCLLAVAGSHILHGIGLTVPGIGTVVAFFLSALAFMIILGTDYLRGIGIALLAIVFSAILVAVFVGLALLFGISLAGLLTVLPGLPGGIPH